MHNPMAGEVPFPLAGEGAVLRFKTENLIRLRSIYGHPPNQKPEYDETGKRIDFFWEILHMGVAGQDPVIVVDLLREGLKQPGGKLPLQLDFSDLPFALQHTEEALQDALFRARWGMNAVELAAKLQEQAQATAEAIGDRNDDGDDEDPLLGSKHDSMSSTAFFEPDAAAVSTPPSSGSSPPTKSSAGAKTRTRRKSAA